MVLNTLLALFISLVTINVNQLICHTWTHITFFVPTNCANQTGSFFEANLEHSKSLANQQNKTIQQNQRTDLEMVCWSLNAVQFSAFISYVLNVNKDGADASIQEGNTVIEFYTAKTKDE